MLDDEEADVRPLARVGTSIGGVWRIDDLLGIGGAATVYSASHASGRRAALKIMHRRMRQSYEARVRFFQEADLARAIDHPARVAVHGIGATDEGTPMLIMELLDGCTLEAVLARLGHLEATTALTIAGEVLSFLTACHEHQVVHRDIKPANVFLTVDGQVKMLDLGVALVTKRPQTGVRLAVGTPNYMAPEQARGAHDVDGRADVFALGALLFHLLSGVQPRFARSTRDTLRVAACERVRPLQLLTPDLPDFVTSLVDNATSFEREQRWASADAMHNAVLACLTRLGRAPCSLAAVARATCEGEDASSVRSTLPEQVRHSDRSRRALRQIATAAE